MVKCPNVSEAAAAIHTKLEEIIALVNEAYEQDLKVDWAIQQDPQSMKWSISKFEVWGKIKLGN